MDHYDVLVWDLRYSPKRVDILYRCSVAADAIEGLVRERDDAVALAEAQAARIAGLTEALEELDVAVDAKFDDLNEPDSVVGSMSKESLARWEARATGAAIIRQVVKERLGQLTIERDYSYIRWQAPSCPDGGHCHHGCMEDCFRLGSCEPLSGVFPDDEWPEEVE